MLGDSEAALRTCAEGLSVDDSDAELRFRKAVIHRHCREPRAAEECLQKILGLRRPHQFSSIDQGIYGHLTRRNLAVPARERGDHAEATGHSRDVLAECPDDREALMVLGH
jgi:hypothetical protein